MNDFPDELLLNIFDRLDQADLGHATNVCHRWRRIASDISLWKRKLVRVINDLSYYAYRINGHRELHSWLEIGQVPYRFRDPGLFGKLWAIKPDERGEVFIHGKYIPVPRFQATYGKSYWFSGVQHHSHGDIPECLEDLLKCVKGMYSDYEPNQVLLNWYPNGHSYIGSHADDEGQLVAGKPIVSISLGATRKFRIRRKTNKEKIGDYDLNHWSIATMGGDFQKRYKHEIVKVAGKKGERVGPRINITFRQFKERREENGVVFKS